MLVGLRASAEWRFFGVPAVTAAVDRAGARDVVTRLPRGLETQLGPTWQDGVELSYGQWQRLALDRGLMRDGPLLFVLDEPTAALDAQSEHALFERFAAASRTAGGEGGVTVLVSHRFSTVRMARPDRRPRRQPGGRGGQPPGADGEARLYAELYGIQARAYR